uniref:Tripartite motif-containing protein 16-like n=1 Tax=Erpetoichthys calabaricus TaxID=27687 RepID=A0A8C4TH04_ERPCA
MAEAQLLVSEDEFTCLLCLETLSDPVTILCGHSFCLKCLSDYWDQSQECSCPQCRHTFIPRPALHRNTLLNELVKKLKKPRLSPHPSQNYSCPGDVQCDACTGEKSRALKSCLTCMASFCQTHLQPHFEVAAWKDHKLTDPVRNLKEKLCVKHHKSLEIFCKTDETCICMMCGVTEHNSHEKVELETEREEKQKQLGVTLSKIKKRLEKRKKKLKKMRRVMEQMKISVDKQVAEHEKTFTDLIHCIEETQWKLIERIREQEKREMEKANGAMERLEKEIKELKRRDAELKELSKTKDHVHFLQVSVVMISEQQYGFMPRKSTRDAMFALRMLMEKFREGQKELHCVFVDLKKAYDRVTERNFCSLTLDINTAHRDLRLSERNKKVTLERKKTKYPDHPDRFDCWWQVLCREALTGTRCYWEVECSGDNMEIGVAYKRLGRKGDGSECGLGINDKSWSLWCFNSKYFVCHNSQQIFINAPYSPRIGVYLDWPAGSLSFYSVSHTMTLLHRFNTSFTEPLYPGFWLDYKCSVTICHLTPGDH